MIENTKLYIVIFLESEFNRMIATALPLTPDR